MAVEPLDDSLPEAGWAIDQVDGLPGNSVLVEEVRRSAVRKGSSRAPLAVRLLEVLVHDNRKLFGEAPVRIDALVVHGGSSSKSSGDFYAPKTVRFDRVADGDRLPIGENGLLVFLGRPRHFLDLFLAVSRDRGDSPDLATLIGKLAASQDVVTAQGELLAMATGVPDPQLLAAALKAALLIGDSVLGALRKATSGTIGLYRNSWLRGHDGWGIGRHPAEGLFRAKGLSFGFEILQEPNEP